MDVRIMEDKFLMIGTWMFVMIGMITLNSFALILSMVASVTVIIRNRNEVITAIVQALDRIKHCLNKNKK